MQSRFPELFQLSPCYPAEAFGNTGSANGALQILLASQVFQQAGAEAAMQQAMLSTASDDGKRATLLISA